MTGDTTTTLRERYSAFESWRSERPFAGSVLLILAGMVIGYVPMQMLRDIGLIDGSFVLIGLTFGLLVSLSGVFVLLRPEHSTFFGVAGVVLSTFSIVGALGGLFVGTVLGTIGGVLCFAWRPTEERDRVATSNETSLSGIRSFLRRNSEVMLLLGLTGIILLYFLHPLLPVVSVPAVEAQTQRNICTQSIPAEIDLTCQNPPSSADFNAGLGGVSISFGNLLADGLSKSEVTVDTSEPDIGTITGTQLVIQNSTISNGFTARKNFEGPSGDPYHFELTASSSEIGGPGGTYTLRISELYGQQLSGSILGISIGDSNILVCEPRNYDTLNLASGTGAQIDLSGVTLNAHFVDAENWVLQDFDLSIEDGTQEITRQVDTDNGDQIGGFLVPDFGPDSSDTCPGSH